MDIEADKREAVVFASSLVQQVNREDVANMVQVQRGMLQRFEKTNEMLINFNQLSGTRYEASVKEFQGHTLLLSDMKKDLDSIFKRIRVLKQRLSKSYPDAFAACSSVIVMEDEEVEEEEDVSKASSQPSTRTSTAQPTARKASSTSRSKPSDADGSASKTRIAQPQKTKSSSRSREGGVGHSVQRSSRPRPEGRESTSLKSAAPRTSSPSASQAKPKPL
ncbi:kxDL motif-containing protein 1-like isoform X2 [Littorina saxatilis]|uniref:kxDL motif-containing protein 1-like isoform X2 n=1 Tax=Littorina saxatilis TaxID=31220 RepID=UPI0038B5B2AE